MASHSQPNRRAVYRIIYPARERPTLTVGEDSFPVLDCSELGLRFEAPAPFQPVLGSTIAGRVRFRRGTEVPVSGEVIRIENGRIALWFRSAGIPLAEVMAERMYVEFAEKSGNLPA